MNENYKFSGGNEMEIKKENDGLNFSRSIQHLEEVKSKSELKELNSLCEEIIDFYKKKQRMLDENLQIEKEKDKFLYQICEKTERLLIEVIYMENKDNQKMKIKKLYKWYFDNLKKNKDLKKISERTEKEWFQEEEEAPPKDEMEKIEEIKKHRSFIGGFESAKKRVTQYQTKKIGNSKKINQISFQDENLNYYGKAFGYNTMSNFKSMKDMNTPNYIATSQQSTKYGTFYNKQGKSKPEINTGTDWFSKTGLDFKKEVKESYSYIRPPYEYEFLYLENKILQQKQKELAEKRSAEEIDKGVVEYGFRKSFYKGAVNEKIEMKEMINKYKELLEIKKIEEEKKKKEEEIKRKIEEEKLRKELEKKKQIAMSKIRQIRKPDPNRKKKKVVIIDNTEEQNQLKEEEKETEVKVREELNTDNADYKNTGEETKPANNINEEENLDNDNKSIEIQIDDKKIDLDNIKYINPYMSEEDIKNTNPFSKTQEMKDVNFYEIKYKKKSVKLKELAIDFQYNNLKEKQLELELNSENDNNVKNGGKVSIPSNLSSYFLFSNKIFYRRNLGRHLNNFKELDAPKNRYQESISPLSFFDNKHQKFRDSPGKKRFENEKIFTENFALKTFYRNRDNFLLIRKTLSAHQEKEFKNTLLYKNSKPKFRIKLDDMAIPPNDKNKFPIYYLPFKRQNGLLTGPKDRKGDKKGKKDKK